MAWLDDRIMTHPKVRKLTPATFQWWTFALCYCSSHGTGGHLDDAIAVLRIPKKSVEDLVTAGLWDREDDGVWVHDWQEYNERRDDALEQRRENDRKRAKAHRDRVRASRPSRDANSPSRDTPPHPSRDESRDDHVTDFRGRAPAPPRARTGARPPRSGDHDHDHDQGPNTALPVATPAHEPSPVSPGRADLNGSTEPDLELPNLHQILRTVEP